MEKEFDGTALARQGVVVVSVAYRLNVFGFFSHRWLQEKAEEGAPYANFGWLDQQAALRWVRRNITVFGGDPTRICVFGQSAGAASVLAQCCAPSNAGLFSRAIMQSGAGL
ncbi:carboxylesterase family protein, partial [Erysipelatoclostridium ramosum]|nr:carboxylesterase family protein [Thomasclavelia ramosa]